MTYPYAVRARTFANTARDPESVRDPSEGLQVLDEVGSLAGGEAEREHRVVVRDHFVEGRESTVVIEAALRVREEAAQRSRPVAPVGSAAGLEFIDANLRAGMHVPARVGVERRHVAAGALRWSAENCPAARRRHRVEAPLRRRAAGQFSALQRSAPAAT